MKKISAVILIMVGVFTAVGVQAAPFAVTSKFTAGVVTTCVFTLNSGAAVSNTPVAVDANNNVCKYDVGTVAEGNNVVSVQYKNIWGTSSAVPFSFVKSLPPTPSGIHLEE